MAVMASLHWILCEWSPALSRSQDMVLSFPQSDWQVVPHKGRVTCQGADMIHGAFG